MSQFPFGLIVFSLSFIMSFVYITMFDISRPFVGFWQIKLDSFDQTLEYLKTTQNEVLHRTDDEAGNEDEATALTARERIHARIRKTFRPDKTSRPR